MLKDSNSETENICDGAMYIVPLPVTITVAPGKTSVMLVFFYPIQRIYFRSMYNFIDQTS